MFFQKLPTVHHPTHVLMSEVELARAMGGMFWKNCKAGKTIFIAESVVVYKISCFQGYTNNGFTKEILWFVCFYAEQVFETSPKRYENEGSIIS